MKDKYFEAICILSEMLLNLRNEIDFNKELIKIKQEEIDRLKMKLDYCEQKEKVSKR